MFSRGDLVQVEGFGGRRAVLRVWSVLDKGLLLCSESSYEQARGGGELVAVGFPLSDIKERLDHRPTGEWGP